MIMGPLQYLLIKWLSFSASTDETWILAAVHFQQAQREETDGGDGGTASWLRADCLTVDGCGGREEGKAIDEWMRKWE